jgi:hypothetical protein
MKVLKIAACGVLIGLAGCQYIKPIAGALSLLIGRQARVVRVEVKVPQADGEPTAKVESPVTGG